MTREQEPKLTGICNECLKKNGCEMYSQLIKSDEKYTVESCEKYIAEPCKDAISRDAVHKLRKYVWVGGIQTVSLDDIDELPSVTPSRHKGRWIKVIDEVNEYGSETYHYECSECGSNKSGWGEYKYCPNCGAEMENQE